MTEIIISTYEKLKEFRDNVNKGTNTYQTVKLGADIDMNGDDWIPIGFNDGNGTIKTFSGTFDGQGHVISNMKINITAGTDNLYFGLFGYGGSLYINNLILDNPIIYNSTNNFLYDDKKADYVSFLCGHNSQTTNAITNCRIINGHININNTGKYIDNILIGCICSFCIYSSTPNIYNITNCYVEVELNIKGNILPDFGGIARNNGFISNCGVKITGIIDLNLKRYPKAMVINGLTTLNNTTNSQVTNCYVHMNFTFNIYARLVTNSYNQVICGIGYRHYGSNKPNISNCYVISNIELNTSTQGATHYFTSSNAATAINCYSFINLSLRQYGNSNNTYINCNNETLQYSIVFANDTEKRGSVSYSGTYKESTTLEDDLQTGKLCYSLNNSSSSDVNFYQSLNFDKYPVLDNRHYIINYDSTNETYSNTSNTDYIFDIWTYDDLMQFKASVNTKGKIAYENKTVNLHRDFDLNNDKWCIIHNFYGTFNGNNHKITNFYMDIAEAILDYTDNNLDVYALGFFGYAYQVLNLSIEMKMTGTYNKSNTKLYIGVIAAHLVLCSNIKSFVTFDECNITSNFTYIVGVACTYTQYVSTYRNCNVNMYLRNSMIASDLQSVISGISDSTHAYNCNVILDIGDTNTFDDDMETNICGISFSNLHTEKCSSYINFVNKSKIWTLRLSGIGHNTLGSTITNSYTYVNVLASVNSNSRISGMTGYYQSKITYCYCVFRCNITIIDQCINNYIGGLTTSNDNELNNVFIDQEISYSIAKSGENNYIGMINFSNTISDTAYCIKNNITQVGANSATLYTSGTEITLDTFKSGQVCYELNNKNQDINNIIFYQSIGSNYYPVFDSNEWKVFYDNSKTPKYYNNIPVFNNTISNYADLITFRNLVNNGNSFETTENNTTTKTTIILQSDIIMNNNNWIPIGIYGFPFKGDFDGNNHTISNFEVYASEYNIHYGLFGNIQNTGTINNLNIENVFISEHVNMTTDTNYSVLCGYMNKTTKILNCHANNCKILIWNANLSINFHIGGLIGRAMDTSTVNNCSLINSHIDAYGNQYLSGLIGGGDSTAIFTNSYCEVIINYQMPSNSSFYGALKGFSGTANVTNCYSINTIRVKNFIQGQISGFIYSGTINNCYVITNIDVEINNNSGGVYINGFSAIATNKTLCYVNPNITYKIIKKTNNIKIGNFSGYSSNKTNNYVVDNSITNIGIIAPSIIHQGTTYYNILDAYQFRNGYVCNNLNNNTLSPFYQTLYSDPYPVLDNTHQPVHIYNNHYYNTLYSLSSYDNILFFYQLLESGYTYENEIIEVSNDFNCGSNSLTPSTKEFKGTLEGNNCTISNFKLLTDDYYRTGFISNSSGIIQNVILNNVTLYDTKAYNSIRQIGFVCGYSVGTITNCHVTNSIIDLKYISTAAYIGGIVGYHDNSLYRCSTDITVNNVISSSSSTIYIGGIIGYIIGSTSDDPSTISYCCSKINYNLNISLTSAQYKVGGICSNTCQVNSCYSTVDYNLNLTSSNAVIYLGGFFGLRNLYPAANINKWSNVYTDTTITYSNSNSNNQLYLSYIIPTDTTTATTYKSKVFAINNKVNKLGSYGYSTAFITDTYYTPIIKHDFSDGTVCYALNNNQSNNPVFYQRINLDEYPLLINSTSIVKQINGIYATAEIGITNYQELKNIATLTNAGSFTYSSVQLLNDIDMNNYVNGETWTPIGTSDHRFTARFYGNYHTIYNMIINVANQFANGFFGYVNGNIYSLIIDNSCKIIVSSASTITSIKYIGMLYGFAFSGCDVYRCTIKGYIDIKNVSNTIYIGGLGSESSTSYVYYCNIEPIITVESDFNNVIFIGGVLRVSTSRITNCNIHPSINVINNAKNRTNNINIGGVVSNNSNANNNILHSFCDTHINITDPYYTSSSTYYKLNTILNYTTTSKSIYSNGNLISINNQLFVESGENKKYTDISIDQVKNGYLCNNILNTGISDWKQNLREDYYPTLDSTHQQVTKIINNQVYINPKYNINSLEEFINFRDEINGITSNVIYSCDFYLNCDINLNNTEWTPINCVNYVTFTGTFYGNNHTISKLSLNHSTYQWTGLFGFVNGLKFKDLIISNSTLTVTPKSRTSINGASFLGYGITTIDNCHVTDSYINVLNGFNTDNNTEFYAGLGISLSGYQSNVVNCTNCSVSLTYEVVETITRTSSKNILMSGIISNSINNQNSSANISYTENVFSNCYANITFNKFEVVTIYYYYGCICSDFNYVKIENCHSNVQTKDVVTITGTSSGSLGWHNFAGIIMDDNVINYASNKYYVNVYVNKCWSNIYYDSSLINSYLIGIVYNPSYTAADKSTFAINCYSIITHNYRIKIYSGEDKTLGIILKGNASNCYSVIKGYFASVAPTATGCIVTMGGIAEQRNSSLTVTNNYGHVRVSGSIQDGTISNYRVGLFIGGILSSNDTEIKSSNYAVSYTTDEITNSLSGTKYTIYNYGTTDYVTAITTDDFTNGKVCYGLNGNQSNINFYQYLKGSDYPMLDSNYPKVLLKNSSYINQETITEINSKYDLFLFRDSVNAGENYVNITININVDIDLKYGDWIPINNDNFRGTIQGNNHTISRFKFYNQQYCGFFGRLNNCKVFNLNFDDIELQFTQKLVTNSYYGIICADKFNSIISGCNVTNYKFNATFNNPTTNSTLYDVYIGGLIGRTDCTLIDYNDNIINCSISKSSIIVTFESNYIQCFIGGLISNNQENQNVSPKIEKSYSNINITVNNKDKVNLYAVGINGFCGSNFQTRQCYSINSIKMINAYNCDISGFAASDCDPIRSWCISRIQADINPKPSDNSVLISGFIKSASSLASANDLKTCYFDTLINYNMSISNTSTTDYVKIGKISVNITDDVSLIKFVDNQIISTGTTTATIIEPTTYNTIRREDFNNGKVCYGLNNGGTYFYQIIGMDAYPVLTNNNSTIKQLTISIYPSPLNEFYYNNDFDGNIYSYYDLCLFRNLVNSGTKFQGQTINLLCDIDMNGDEWIPIGYVFDKPFMGSFNGNNHVIKNMVLRLNLSFDTTVTYQCIGLFGIVGDTEQSDNIMIKDIIIDKTCSMKYNKYTGDIYCSYLVGRLNKGTIDNCKIYADVRLNNASNQIYYGSFTGDININNCIISNCYVNNNIVTNNMSVMLISAIAINTNTISDENTTKYINNSCVINIRSISDKEILGIVIIGLIRPLVENESININNYVNNCLLINTTILDDIIPTIAIWIHYSIEQLNSNNYVNNDYPFIKNTDESKTSIALGTYSSEDFKSGKICYLLNGNQSNIKFYQNLEINKDIAPIPDNSHQQVYKSTTNNIDTYYNRPLNELPTQQLAVIIYNLANPTLLYDVNISNNNLYQSLYYNDINFALSVNNSVYSVTQSIEKYIYDIYHSSKNYKLESIDLIYFKFKLFNEIIKKKLTIGDVIMYNEYFAKLVNNLPIELVKTELNYYKRLCFYLRDKNALDTEHYNLIFGDE